ncbi:MAG TPA: putative Ig domain-containing protein, partial [Candidatus Limnocylindrales bacterium]
VSDQLESREGLPLAAPFVADFVAASDFSTFVDLTFDTSRSDRATGTISYDVTVTNVSALGLVTPLLLVLDPAAFFDGQPVGSPGPNENGLFLIDIGASVTGGILGPGQSTQARTITIQNPEGLSAAFQHGLFALPAADGAPLFGSAPITSAEAGQPYAYQALAQDPDGESLSFLLYAGPGGMSVDAATGLVTWLPTPDDPARARVVLQAYDPRGGRATQEFTVDVAGVNRAPDVTPLAAEIRGREGQRLRIGVSATDADGDALIFWADNLPPGAVFDAAARVIDWTPDSGSAGTYADVRLAVSDGRRDVVQAFTVIIAPGNQAPRLERPADRTLRQGEAFRLQLQADDPDGDAVTYASALLPPGATLHPDTGLFEWTPTFFQAGVFTVPLTAGDGQEGATETATLTVLNVNGAPTFQGLGDPFQVQEGQPLAVRAFAFDPDNPGFVPQDRLADGTLTELESTEATVVVEAAGLPGGATFDAATGMFQWTPGFADAGTYHVVFTATDDGDGTGTPQSALAELVITVLNTNRPPVLAEIPNVVVARDEGVEATVSATDPDGNPLVLSAANALPGFPLPAFVHFIDNGDGTGLVQLTPGFGDRGNYTIVLTAADDGDGGGAAAVLSDQISFVVTVESPNEPPVLSVIGDKVAVVGEPLEFTLRVSDADQDPLTFGTVGLPAGATLTRDIVYGTATFSWTPTPADQGAHVLGFIVTDSGNSGAGEILSDGEVLTVVVRLTNAAPVLAPVGDRTVAEGETLVLPLAAVDPDGDALTFTATNLPVGASLDPRTGVLAWSPGFFQAGRYEGIELRASDGHRASAETIALTVTNTNRPPVLVPLPAQSGREGTALQFTLAAGDVDGDALAFSVASLPDGARLDAHTGQFTWTPDFTQAGHYVLGFGVADGTTGTDTIDVVVDIANVDRAPAIAVGNHQALLGRELAFTVSSTDPDAGDVLAFSAEGLPDGATLDPVTGDFRWTPGAGQAGDYVVSFQVSDGELASARSVVLRATSAPQAPSVTIELTPSFPVVPGQSVLVRPAATGFAAIAGLAVTVDGTPVVLDAQGRAPVTAGAPGKIVV